jgi:hypothetical protein
LRFICYGNPDDAPFYSLLKIESIFSNSENIFSLTLIILSPHLPQEVSYVFEKGDEGSRGQGFKD